MSRPVDGSGDVSLYRDLFKDKKAKGTSPIGQLWQRACQAFKKSEEDASCLSYLSGDQKTKLSQIVEEYERQGANDQATDRKIAPQVQETQASETESHGSLPAIADPLKEETPVTPEPPVTIVSKEEAPAFADKADAAKALKEGIGAHSSLREAAARELVKDQTTYEGEGLLVIKRKHENGDEKIQVFHVEDKIGKITQGAYNAIYRIREEVFGNAYKDKTAILREAKDKTAILREALPDKAPGTDAQVLGWIEKHNGGVMPEGIRKQYKIEGRVMKDYQEGDLYAAKFGSGNNRLDGRQAFRALKGPMQVLLYFKKNGIAHIDLKIENILLENKPGEEPQARIIDFDNVRIFPDLSEDTPNQQDVAKEILQFFGDPSNDKAYTADNQPALEPYLYHQYMEEIKPTLEALSRGETLSPEKMAEFYTNYKHMKIGVEKMQVAQMGMVLGLAIFGDQFHWLTFDHVAQDLGALDLLILDNYEEPVAGELFWLLGGMLDPSVGGRFTVEEAYKQYESLLTKI